MKKGNLIILLAVVTLLTPAWFGCAKMSGNVAANKRVEVPKASSVPYPMVHFQFDKDEILAGDLPSIDADAEWMKNNRDAVVILEGHCDEIGPRDYNMELGDKRARAIKESLIERGVGHDRIIMVVSYGDTQPLDPSHNREAWSKNRRVEFILR